MAKMVNYYGDAEIQIKGVKENAEREKEKLIQERFDLDADLAELYDQRRQLMGALGEGRVSNPPAPGLKPKRTVLSDADATKFKGQEAEIEGQIATTTAAQQENFRQQCDVQRVIDNLSKAAAFLAAPDIMDVYFLSEREREENAIRL